MTSNSSVTSDFLPSTDGRSCAECSRRKVRCDRKVPCANCVRMQATCIFPKFRRRPTRHRKTLKARSQANPPTLPSTSRELQLPRSVHDVDTDLPEQGPSVGLPAAPNNAGTLRVEEAPWLLSERNRSRYVGNVFWTNMSRQIEEMRDVLDPSGSEREDGDDEQTSARRPSPQGRGSHSSFIFSPVDNNGQALCTLYPTSSQLLTIFDVFQENVDPVAKIFHRPTIRTAILDSISHLDSLNRTREVVLFSLYYAALTSLNPHDCNRLFGYELSFLLPLYRFAVEQALARAHFLDSQSLDVLSALVLFLICVRRHDNSRFVSSLLGVAIRNAQSMGLHRDGTHFNLSPHQTEIRRRVWWHISVLDLRSSEDHGSDPTILDCSHDTKFPTNLNDSDLSIEETVARAERTGTSEMTFCLVRFEVDIAIRKLHYHDPLGKHDSQPRTWESKRQLIASIEHHFEERYIKHCDITQPVDWVSATWARLMLAKMWLTVYLPKRIRGDHCSGPSPHSSRLAFEKAIEVLELADLLETSPRAERWQWLFLTHTQWHAVVFALACLCEWPNDLLSNRAWKVVKRVFERWQPQFHAKKGMLWKPVRRLIQKAERIRRKTRFDCQEAYTTLPIENSAAEESLVSNSTLSNFAPNPQSITQAGIERSTNFPPDGSINLSANVTTAFLNGGLDVASGSDTSETHNYWLDWDEFVQEMSGDVTDNQGMSDMRPSAAEQGYAGQFWATI